LFNTVIYPEPIGGTQSGSLEGNNRPHEKFTIEAIAIGNGTAGRETGRNLLRGLGLPDKVPVVMRQ